MLDFYYIKLPDFMSFEWQLQIYRNDIPRREVYRFDYLCELYRYEIRGNYKQFLTASLMEFEKYYDASKYQGYLKYLEI